MRSLPKQTMAAQPSSRRPSRIPAWREDEIRLNCEPLRHLTYPHATDLLRRVHRRIDSLRFQLWSSMKELEELTIRLQMAHEDRSPKPKNILNSSQSPTLFSQGE